MEECCATHAATRSSFERCPACGEPGRLVDRLTVKALLCAPALARLPPHEHRFCPTPGCSVVYFGRNDGTAETAVFERQEVAVPVFQKEPPGERLVCYCFAVSEAEIRREIVETGCSTAANRVAALVKAGRCACEVRNPQGRCCLGNVASATRAARAALAG